MTALIIHGHFYQPPRENPWTGQIDVQPSAAPYHDWNERVHSECYGPNAFANIGEKDVINNYRNISFNFGPTLLSWLNSYQPRTYQRILDGDKQSAATRSGHGNAIAQAYGHAILPLCNDRDRLTQVAWGIADFEFRFGRNPESLWLPETACNNETLALLIERGLRYVILAPEQAAQLRKGGEDPWVQVPRGDIDTAQSYKYTHKDRSGRSIAVFFYHGGLARAIAFERALTSSRGLVDHFLHVARTGELVNVATDGETYGHHFKFGDLCLAHALEVEAKQAGFWITNYGEYLDRHPPEVEVQISLGESGEGSSWSCAHGVSRWTRDCGCSTGGQPGWNQGWREPLRFALNFLRDSAATNFQDMGAELFRDPWEARNEFIQVLLAPDSWPDLLTSKQRQILSTTQEVRARTLLDIQRFSMLMFTSCGWFFSDLASLETVQILRYAARVLELEKELGLESPRSEFLEMLSVAKSNDPKKGNGADIYLRYAEQDRTVDPTVV